EGAHRGAGLGHRFLKHIERSRLFVHLLDGVKFLEDATKPDEPETPGKSFDDAIEALVQRYCVIRNELGLFIEALLRQPEIVVLNKLDVLAYDPALVERARKALRQRIASIRGAHPINGEPFVISAVAGEGVQELIFTIQAEIDAQKASVPGAKSATR